MPLLIVDAVLQAWHMMHCQQKMLLSSYSLGAHP